MPTQTVSQSAPDTAATNASLDAYNVAIGQLGDANNALAAMQATPRPADDASGHDTGGKQWDKNYADASAAVAAAKTQAAQAARQYAQILQDQAKTAAADTSPAGQALTAQRQAQADYVQAKADSYAATTASAQQAAEQRAQAALTRANASITKADTLTTANGIYSKDDVAHPAPDGSPGWRLTTDANGNPLPGTRNPAQDALTQAQANKTQADADLANATLPADKATAQAKVDLANAQIAKAQADNALAAATAPDDIAAAKLKVEAAQQALDQAKALAPGAVSQQAATTANTQATTAETTANTAATVQKTAQANTPTIVGTPSATDQLITTRDPNTGALSSVPNPNAPVADIGAKVQQLQQQAQAQRDKLQQQVLNGSLTQADALQQFNDFWNTTVEPQKQAIAATARTQQQQDFTNQANARTSQNQSDQQQSSTANDLLTNVNNQATLGSNLLQKRADLANTTAQNVIGIGTGSKNFGIAGAMPNISGLYGAATQNATDQLGGQSTMDAATRLVQQIDPTNKTGFAAHAAAALSQVLDRQQQQQPLQAPVQGDPTAALQASQYSGTFAGASPVTTIAPDGTVTINHTPAATSAPSMPDYAAASINNPALGATPATQPIPAYAGVGPSSPNNPFN